MGFNLSDEKSGKFRSLQYCRRLWRKTKAELLNFLNIALGSITELNTQIDIAIMLDFIPEKEKADKCRELALSVKRQLLGLIKANNK